MNRIVTDINPSILKTYEKQLNHQQFDELPITKLFGKNSGIVIYNDQDVKIYEKGNYQQIPSFSAQDILCIPEYTIHSEINIYEKITDQGKRHTITMKEKDDLKIYLLDEHNRFIYQPSDLPFDSLNEKQIKLLSNSYFESHSILKHTFKVNTKKSYTMVIFLDLSFPEVQDQLARLVIVFLFSCLLIYGIITFLFIHFLNKKIKKPLNTLFHKLNHFENNEELNEEYQGPKEFVEIFKSFDSLSYRLKQSEEERLQLEKDRQKMLSDISHDLRTPISIIQGYAKALNDGMIPKDEKSKYLDIIEHKAADLNELINIFYEYSKMENPHYALKLVPTDICIFLRDYVADKYLELEIAGFMVEVDIPEIHVICDLDRMNLRRALDNLVNNSIKHNEKGLTLTFSLTLSENSVSVIVKDDGIGIPEELQTTIFSPFVVGERSRNKHGSGLGLAVTKKIVEAHQGTIRLLKVTKGTAIEIIFPIKYPEKIHI